VADKNGSRTWRVWWRTCMGRTARATRVLQRLRRVPGLGHVRVRIRRRRVASSLPTVAHPGDGVRRARAEPEAGRGERHHIGHRPQGHAQAGAARHFQPDPPARMCKVMGDDRGDGSYILTAPQHRSRAPSRRCPSLLHRPEPPDTTKAG
jgi:hypothetical protein